jgi:hypothetical protein
MPVARRAPPIVALLLALSPAVSAGGQGHPARAEVSCRSWMARTLEAADRMPEQRWRDTIVASLDRSCAAIPAVLRQASARTRTTHDPMERGRLLAVASEAVLGRGCVTRQPLADARAIAAICPLPDRPEFRLQAGVLLDLRAVDYLVVNAVVRSLIDAGEYGAEGERLFLYFTLSAALQGEGSRRHKAP